MFMERWVCYILVRWHAGPVNLYPTPLPPLCQVIGILLFLAIDDRPFVDVGATPWFNIDITFSIDIYVTTSLNIAAMPFYAIDIPLFFAIDDRPSVDIDVTPWWNIDIMFSIDIDVTTCLNIAAMPFYAIDIPLFFAIDDIPSVDIDVTACSNIDVMPF
jgi:hypothetical protein